MADSGCVSCCSSVPSIAIVKSALPRVKTSRFPSGDHAGSVSHSSPPESVTFVSPVPSALMTKRSPPRSKASFVPSADHAGLFSALLSVDPAAVKRWRSLPSASTV